MKYIYYRSKNLCFPLITTLFLSTITGGSAQTLIPAPSGITFQSPQCSTLCEPDFWLSSSDEQIEAAIARTSNLDALDWENRSAIHFAAGFGSVRQVEMLLIAGADPNGGVLETGFRSPLASILSYGLHYQYDRSEFEVLGSSFSGVTAFDRRQEIGKLHARKYRARDIANLLLAYGAEIDPETPAEVSPFACAILSRNQPLLDVFFQHESGEQLVAKYGTPTCTIYLISETGLFGNSWLSVVPIQT